MDTQKTNDQKKIAIVYYSYEGSTQMLAEALAEVIGGDCIRIVPKKEMTAKGLAKFIWAGIRVLMDKRPEILPIATDFSAYDCVIIGSPIWAGDMAPPMYTFLESGILKGKRVACFYGHKSDEGNVLEKIQAAVERDNQFISGCSCKAVATHFERERDRLIQWAENLEGC